MYPEQWSEPFVTADNLIRVAGIHDSPPEKLHVCGPIPPLSCNETPTIGAGSYKAHRIPIAEG